MAIVSTEQAKQREFEIDELIEYHRDKLAELEKQLEQNKIDQLADMNEARNDEINDYCNR